MLNRPIQVRVCRFAWPARIPVTWCHQVHGYPSRKENLQEQLPAVQMVLPAQDWPAAARAPYIDEMAPEVGGVRILGLL